MAVQYTNRKGDVYIPQAGKTKSGKPHYVQDLGKESFYDLI